MGSGLCWYNFPSPALKLPAVLWPASGCWGRSHSPPQRLEGMICSIRNPCEMWCEMVNSFGISMSGRSVAVSFITSTTWAAPPTCSSHGIRTFHRQASSRREREPNDKDRQRPRLSEHVSFLLHVRRDRPRRKAAYVILVDVVPLKKLPNGFQVPHR